MKVEANKTYVGVVEDNEDPKKLGRVRVRVLDVFDNLEVTDIPWATPWKDLNGNQFNVPENGKVVLVVFDSGDEYKPEFISADHYNVNLERKLESLSNEDYISMKSLIFDHKTQVYVNDKEGLKLDHKYNNVNITESGVSINLKDNNAHVNIGDATAGQQAILGNSWMDWFDDFAKVLITTPYLVPGLAVTPTPELLRVIMKYTQLRDIKFLSHHVNIVDNNKVSTVINTKRENTPQLGDAWNSTNVENKITTNTNDNFKPTEGAKPEYDVSRVEPSTLDPLLSGLTSSILNIATSSIIPPLEPLTSPESNPKIDKMIKYMKSKGYVVYEGIGVLNILSMQSIKKDSGEISNKFDDILNLFFKNENGNWNLFEYKITTMAGFVPGTTNLPQNVALLSLGQYIDQGEIVVKSRYKYLKLNRSTVHRNNNLNRYNFYSPKSPTRYGMSISRSTDSGSAENVYNYSEGSQVFKMASQYQQFIDFCDAQITLSNKNSFTYTLCRQSDFDTFE
jgi:hypothetical protein